ncbi:hypothetical protein DL89DRAFT_320923 [Linderina pennispora]|uniref:BZIP domain-containing protein n=1 Tax=Linderina pennispora TaxID=61395 RepID=A0A1Y1WJP5_9FUNG|nr:uncharacterized protein DL89DRAFT_320923 [Linderina pennispora]ORX73324.1 hypothetical protein DL89DRAFT_320923 [Linderina pennispora]
MSRKRPRETSTVMPGGSQRQSNSARSVDVRELSPQSRRRYQSKLSSARLRERQRQRTAEAERDIQQLEVRIQSLQYMIAFYKEQQMRQREDTHGFTLPSRGISTGQPLSRAAPAGPASANNTAHQANTNLRELSPESRRRYQSKLSSARLRRRQRERTAAVEEDVRQLETRVLSLQNMIDHLSLIRGRMAGVIQEMQPDHPYNGSGGAANLDGGSRISISFLTNPHG